MSHTYMLHRQAVSNSIPENPKALSPCMHTTGSRDLWPFPTALQSLSITMAAAIAKPHPTPIVPNVPASSLWRGRKDCSIVLPISIVLEPSLTMSV